MGTMNPVWNGAGGFIRVDMNSSTRINVYHPDLPPTVTIERGAIHDHRYTMKSRCLHGGLEHIIYKAVDREGGHYTVYEVINDEFYISKEVDLVTEDRVFVQAGEEFHFGGPDWYHRVVPHGQTVTCVTRIADVSEGRPCRILCKTGLTPMNAFDPERAPSAMMMRMHVAAAVSGIVFSDVFA